MTQITDNLGHIRTRVAAAAHRSGRDPASIGLLAVSKKQPPERVLAAIEAGQRDFGENYLNEALAKMAGIGSMLRWHFIGPVQSNKTRGIAEHFDWVHGIDRLRVARRLSEQRPLNLPPINLCIQVNTAGESTKSGIAPEQLGDLAQAVSELPRTRLRGLMCIPPLATEFERQREPFRVLRLLKEDLSGLGIELDTLSMGMTADFEAAIAEGATWIRIGTAIFGPRD